MVDTSAWIEFLRGTGTAAHHQVKELLSKGTPIATSEPIVMELLAGGRDEAHVLQLRRLVSGLHLLAIEGMPDFEDAASIFRNCRRAGETIRSLTDCLIAVVALRHELELLHRDSDFETIARHSDLRQFRG